MIFFAAMLEALLAPVEHTVTACGEVKVRQKMFYNSEQRPSKLWLFWKKTNYHLKSHTKINFSALKLQKNKFGSTVVDESVFSVDLDFCTQPGTALEKFIEETTTVVNTLFPPKDHPGYLDFVTKIFVVLITMKGTIDEKPTFNEKRIELFLESYLTAVGYGIKDNISNANRDHQPALFCYVQELMSRHKANAMMCARATFDLLRALNHETKKPAKWKLWM